MSDLDYVRNMTYEQYNSALKQRDAKIERLMAALLATWNEVYGPLPTDLLNEVEALLNGTRTEQTDPEDHKTPAMAGEVWDECFEEIIKELRAEIERLQHDVDRYMAIANEHVNEVERLRAENELLHETIVIAENRLEAALLGDTVCKDCVEVARSYLQAALAPIKTAEG
jgi:hypothetical protein